MHLQHELFEFLRCWLPAVSLWVFIFRSPLLCDLVETFSTGEPTTREDLQVWLLERGHHKLLTLYTCTVCQALWTTLFACSWTVVSRGEISPFLLGEVIWCFCVYPFTLITLCLILKALR